MEIKTKNRKIGTNHPAYFIADVAANHDGDLQRAIDLIYLVAEAGGDAAKFQNFKANKIVSKTGFEELGKGLAHQAKWKKSVYEIYQDASISYDWTPILKETCDKAGIDYFTSPYDFESVDAVDPFVDVYKIGSGDITWLEIIEYIAKKGKPVFIATGASDSKDVKRAMDLLLKTSKEIVLMQCNTNYTGSLENFKYVNLNVLNTFKAEYPGVIIGLSDHTPGPSTAMGAIALGAKVIEKHFTDDNNREGPDHPFSMNPKTWREMIDRCRELEASMGDGVKRVEENEKASILVQRRSLRAKKKLEPGHRISLDDLVALRPAPEDSFHPYEGHLLIGKKISATISEGQHFTKGILND